MYWDILKIKILSNNEIEVQFRDGLRGTLEFLPSYFQGVFASLRNPKEFQKAYVEKGVLTWPGELDLAPDAMHEEIRKNRKWTLS